MKIHLKEECKDLSRCKNIKNCTKRHPKFCSKYASGQCSFANDCAYKHQKPIIHNEDYKMAETVKQLEKVVHSLTRKVLSLEREITEIKQKSSCGEAGEGKEIVSEVIKGKSEDKAFNPERTSTPKNKDAKEKATKSENKKSCTFA